MKRPLLFAIALSPIALLGLTVLANYILGCTGNLGPSGNHCRHASDSLGSALVGLMYVGAFGWFVTIPLAVLLAIVSKPSSKGARRATK